MYKAYASAFVTYLLTYCKGVDFQRIILFGSVAKDEATKESDIDLFIEPKGNGKDDGILKTLEKFYQSKEALFFRAKGIENKINLIIGKLDAWKDLKKSIESTGIVLLGKYVPQGVRGTKYALVFWDHIDKNRGAFLNKVYGFTVDKKRYEGLMSKFGGQKIGKSCVMIPIQHREEILDLMKHHKVNGKIIEVFF